VLIWSLFLSNWVTSLLGLALVTPLSRLTTVRTGLIVPLVLALATVGAFADQQRIGDVVVAILFGAAGYYMKKHGWPRIPLVVALLLGASLERHLHVTLRLYELDRLDVMTRPAALLLLVLVTATVASSLLGRARVAREVPS
jgi:TctA family transporter